MLAKPVIVAMAVMLALSGCQSEQMPTPSPTPTGALGSESSSGSSSSSDVDVSGVTGAEADGSLVDPCSLLSVEEIEAATGVGVLTVVRGAVKDDGSQICAYAMDATGSTAAALAGTPGLPSGELGDVVNGLKAGGAVIGVILSAQDPEADYSGSSDDEGDGPPPEVQATRLNLGKGGIVVATPNGGAAFAANETNVLLTIMDLIAGPADSEALTTLITTAYGRL